MRILLIDAKPKLAQALAEFPGVQVGLLPLLPVPSEATARGVRIWPYQYATKLNPWAIGQVRRAIKEFQPDVVHPFFGRPLSHTLLATTGWRRRPKIISQRAITRDLSWLDPGNWITYLHPSIDLHGCVSESVKDSLVRSGIAANRCQVTYDSMKYVPAQCPGRPALKDLDIPEGAFVVATIANMRRVKGADVLLAAAALCADIPDIYWVLWGRVHDPLVDELARDPRIAARVRLAGHQPKATELVSGADLFVMPSRAEAFCQALLEAMYQGVCPIVSDAGGNKEAVRHGQDGFVVPREDPAALAAAIRTLYNDRPRMQRYAATARQRVVESFNIEKLAERMMQMYREVLNRSADLAAVSAAA